ncbi:MAG: L-aspartate oxidase [Gammaproteobacteria bacterium]|nr:L-aspartate oxidase [Gammaproteobacteria bacterium]
MNNNDNNYQYDVIVIGSGAAGLTLALTLAPKARVALIAKKALTNTATLRAQGGIAAVLNHDDSPELHAQDTIDAGVSLCDEEIVRFAVEQGPPSIQWLIDQGVAFTRDSPNNSRYHLTREGGHSRRRVIHSADATGRALETTLAQLASDESNIDIFEDHIAIDLITGNKLGIKENRCLGVYVLNTKNSQVLTFSAKSTALATGGAGKVYLYTSNPDIATGDGIAMAWRAGCRIANMEFIQFHPTCLFHPDAKSFLITEAIRGEGGKLLLPDRTPFMHKFDSRGELAPRDIVARAIDHEMKRLGSDFVYLDISHKSADFILQHFPTVHARCLKFGFDITSEPIPVVPAAHYICGGIMTDLSGRADIEGLYAIGETAFTGMHGANRMASNSLLECIVFARTASEDILEKLEISSSPTQLPAWDESQICDSDEQVVIAHDWHELRRFMWNYVGIERSNKRLQRARNRIELLQKEIDEYYSRFRISSNLIELRNLALVAELIIRSASQRKESRGLHFNINYPTLDNTQPPSNTVLCPKNYLKAPKWRAEP